jgi:RND family efflux transporter MFP subunit
MNSQGDLEKNKTGSGFFKLLVVLLAILILVGAVTLLQRKSEYKTLAKETEAMSIPVVSVVHPVTELGGEDLVQPGTMEPYVESPIYARTNGYLKRWYHDIGSRVDKGGLLAEIDTPEVDQQLSQSRADLATAQANARLSEITANRYAELLKTDGVSRQEADNSAGDLAAKKAIVQSAEANVRRLENMKSFQRVYAPFAGVITRRNVDIGTLINAGNTGASQQLFSLAQTNPLRVYVRVPEVYANSIHPGLGAYLQLAQFPGRKFECQLVRTAESIDAGTRTLLTEVDVPNPRGELFPGGYAQVHMAVRISGARLQVPVNAFLFRAEGLRVPVVDGNHKIHLRQITVGRDYGTSLEVLQGVEESDWIVLNPADSLEEGQEVRMKELAAKPSLGPSAVSPGQPQKTEAVPQQPIGAKKQ